MLDEIDPATGEATVGSFANLGLPSEGFVADIEEMRLIQLSAHETIERAGKTNGIGKDGFGDPLPFHLVMQKATLFLDLFDGSGDAIVGLYIIPHFKCDPADRGGIEGIFAAIIRSRKENGNPSIARTHDHSETQLGLGITDPALAGLYILIYHAHL